MANKAESIVDMVAAITAATSRGPIIARDGNSSINFPTMNKVVLSDSLLSSPGKMAIAIIPRSTKKKVVTNGIKAIT